MFCFLLKHLTRIAAATVRAGTLSEQPSSWAELSCDAKLIWQATNCRSISLSLAAHFHMLPLMLYKLSPVLFLSCLLPRSIQCFHSSVCTTTSAQSPQLLTTTTAAQLQLEHDILILLFTHPIWRAVVVGPPLSPSKRAVSVSVCLPIAFKRPWHFLCSLPCSLPFSPLLSNWPLNWCDNNLWVFDRWKEERCILALADDEDDIFLKRMSTFSLFLKKRSMALAKFAVNSFWCAALSPCNLLCSEYELLQLCSVHFLSSSKRLHRRRRRWMNN